VEGAGVEDQPEAAADVSRAQRGDVTADDPHRDAGSTVPPAGASHGRPDQLDAGHVPATLGQTNAPHRPAGSDIQRPPERAAAALLVAGEQPAQRVCERRMAGNFLPWVEPTR
jgi:hypothetical protein